MTSIERPRARRHRLQYWDEYCRERERKYPVRTIPAKEIKRRGISAVDEHVRDGPVHVIRNDQPAYVIMDEAQYQELLAA